ncbi:MAG: MCE family protein [Flavobacteriaceae bacterium CG_4_8_14_3_um_filter_34_10]|nr:MCE family protein [Flavobacteriia bacterium]OIP49852.1 MAG: ABC transporter permease [Flavobacteriaceae bacterium CG2_30_34_30]PIQ18916.1 MAG: ABC transporter permease [Flavobacteriaceae bacterium CG18_big_fil_WC_8_21_14_2_50_34_36]PIV48969.1 MAG: MCE family protein [Flavobacteriaceae bacterium CG02_land_8_20_14_3_00_34_13]PIX10503.1 MAG: MCE family protein [Flavobacteriaceae bacterium CG_4_8_14_3_um_filter_34_10]
MKKTNTQNLQLGIFVILGLLIFVIAVYYIGKQQNLFGNTTQISSVFKNVNGLQLGNNVRFSGVNVGTVKNISILNDTAICVDMIIQNKTLTLIKKNALATISSDGLVGSMIVNILPGEESASEHIQLGDTIKSISKIATADMLTTLNTTNENAALLTADLLKITNAINKGEGLLGALIKDETMATEIKQSISTLQLISKSALQTVTKLNKMIDAIDIKNSVAGVLLNDTISAKKMSFLIESLNQSAIEINEITANFNAFSKELKNNEGALNYVMNDTIFVNHLDSSMKNIDQATEKLNENMEALKHNFLFRRYFRKLERENAKDEKN